MSGKTLLGDWFITDYVHPFFNAKNDAEMFTQMVWISFFYTLSVVFSMALFPAPYGKHMLLLQSTGLPIDTDVLDLIKGRYSSSKFGFLIPGKFAWMTQESPAFIVPLVLFWTTSATCWNNTANKALVIGLIAHYIQR